MKLEAPYKQYEGKWLSNRGGSQNPNYYIAKFIEIEASSAKWPILLFLVVNEHGISELSWLVEPSFIHEYASSEKHQEIIRGVFKGFYH